MSKQVKAYVDYEDETKTHYYINFEIIEILPKIETTKKYNNECVKIESVKLDVENGDNIYNYDFYKITYIDYEDFNSNNDDDFTIEDFTTKKYVCIERK